MEQWYKDENLEICFDTKPSVRIRYALPTDTLSTKENKKKYPFVNVRTLNVKIKYIDKLYTFTIPKGYKWDGATIPRFVWRLIGSNTQPEFLIASLIHDTLCENHHYIDSNRRLSTIIFRSLLIVAGVKTFKANLMAEFVDAFQRTQGWKN